MIRPALIFLDYISPRAIALAWWQWALSEIHPLHEDVPFILQRIAFLQR